VAALAPISFARRGGLAYRAIMAIDRLSLINFRNHADLLIEPGCGLVVLTGENGAGKTNVLEALSLLSPGRGLRGAALADMARLGAAGDFAVAARTQGTMLATGMRAEAPGKRQVRINGAVASAASLGEWLSFIWVTPAMDRLFMDAAGDRRRFLDRLVLALEPSHAHHASRYEAAMRQRNRLLSDETNRPDPDWLSALETQMAEHGATVHAARIRLVEALSAQISDQDEGPFARALLSLSGWEDNGAFVDQLARGRSMDAASGRTLTGPHRVDLLVTHAAKAHSAARSSTGEQKALLLGIVLAHAALVMERTGRTPILLLDEVAAHLDPVRRNALFDRLIARGGQAWLTGTEVAPFRDLPATFVTIAST
jgi:DNA replication and repair protein RecF